MTAAGGALEALFGEVRALKVRVTELEDGHRWLEDALVGKEVGWGDPVGPPEEVFGPDVVPSTDHLGRHGQG